MTEFASLGAFAEHVLKAAIAEEVALREGLSRCARAVEKEAKAEVGTYQDAAGPFAGWAGLADSTKEDRVRRGFTEDDPGLRTGEMRDGIGTAMSATGLEATIGSDDDHLVYFELGTAKQPPRSVLGIAMARKLPEIQAVLGASALAGLVGRDVVNRVLPIEEP